METLDFKLEIFMLINKMGVFHSLNKAVTFAHIYLIWRLPNIFVDEN